MKAFRQEVRLFYIGALQYMQKKFPLQDPLLKFAIFLNPSNRLSVTFNEIKSLLVLFPDLISKEQYDVLFAEYTDYQTADDLPFHDESERIDTYILVFTLLPEKFI